MLEYKEAPIIIGFILFLLVSIGSKIFQEKCNDKKQFTRSEMGITVILPGIVSGFIGYYFTNEYNRHYQDYIMLQKVLIELDSMIKSKIIYLFSENVDHIITNQYTYETNPFDKIHPHNDHYPIKIQKVK